MSPSTRLRKSAAVAVVTLFPGLLALSALKLDDLMTAEQQRGGKCGGEVDIKAAYASSFSLLAASSNSRPQLRGGGSGDEVSPNLFDVANVTVDETSVKIGDGLVMHSKLVRVAIMSVSETLEQRRLNVAAINYDPASEAIDAGINMLEAPDLFCPKCIRLCFCDDGAYLHVDNERYEVGSIMLNGKSLCKGDKNAIRAFVASQPTGSEVFTVQLKRVPNAPFRVRLTAASRDLDASDGLVFHSAEFVKGDLGYMVPGKISVGASATTDPLAIYVGGNKVACIKNIINSEEKAEVRRGKRVSVLPTYTKVTLGTDEFELLDMPKDDTLCLATRVMNLLQSGDAVIDVCTPM